MMAEHMAKAETPEQAPSFQAQYRAHMKALGKKGGKISGAKRMEMPVELRKAIALKAARARWSKRPKS